MSGRAKEDYCKNLLNNFLDSNTDISRPKNHKETNIIDIQRGKCYWLGFTMSLDDLYIPHSPFAVSVDRLDSSGDYTPDNIVLTLRFSNKGRGSYDDLGFKRRMRKLIREAY